MSFISSLENYTVVPDLFPYPCIFFFFLIAPSIPDIAADNPKGAATFFNTEVAGLINFGKNLIKNDPKPLPVLLFFYLCFA